MANTYKARVRLALGVQEFIDTAGSNDNGPINHNAFDVLQNLTATGTTGSPAISKGGSFEFTLSGGSLSVDLTNLTGTNGVTVDATGLKLQAMLLRQPAGNAVMTIKKGVTNGYKPGGSSDFSISLTAGEAAAFLFDETSDEVGASLKTLDLAGTGTQKLQAVLLFG